MKRLHIATEANGWTGWGQWASWVAWYAAKAGWSVSIDGADPGLWPIPLKHAPHWLTIDRNPGAVDVLISTAGNHHVPERPAGITAQRWAIATFVEDTLIRPREVERYNAADVTICGSQWNTDLLTKNGVQNAMTCVQGVDSHVWNTEARAHHRRNVFDGRRVIFSGGKLEYRKAQDVVVAAFRDYLKIDPDAILLTAWQNAWPKSMKGIDAMGYVEGWPAVQSNGQLDIQGWLEKNGVPRKNTRDLGICPNWALPQIVSEADLAVFPNRCEGGENLVALECRALNITTPANRCTGQEWIFEYGCMRRGAPALVPVAPHGGYHGTEGWSEPDLRVLTMDMEDLRFTPNASPPSWETAALHILTTALRPSQPAEPPR